MAGEAGKRAADVLARRLYAAGCRHAFGMPGGEVLTLLDAFVRAGIEFHLAKHENAGGFMAEGTWHMSGAPAVLLATIGPGLTNAVNVVANASQDRVPLIVISGAIEVSEAATYTHQVVDHRAILKSLVKGSYELTAGAAGAIADKAVNVAMDMRPGPVHIDVPIAVAGAAAEDYPWRRSTPAPVAPAEGKSLDEARQWLAAAERVHRGDGRSMRCLGWRRVAAARWQAAGSCTTGADPPPGGWPPRCRPRRPDRAPLPG